MKAAESGSLLQPFKRLEASKVNSIHDLYTQCVCDVAEDAYNIFHCWNLSRDEREQA